ncbi:MAG: penicillin-binding transpeptidase domain-containing protein [candidate division Zixibacteria bacterium]|nr:penicillin-binding transpeptidase domain-containing protein [candidate division Zixibacteria bacterium]
MKLTRQQRLRLGVLFVMIVLFFMVASARLVHLQVIKHDQYEKVVTRQSAGEIEIPADRGLIYDRNGCVVADNIVLASLYAYPSDEKELKKAARYLEKVLNLKPGTARKKYNLSPRRFRWIKRQLDDGLAEKITADAPSGLYLRKENQRSYPYGLIGKQVLGFTDIDNCGQSGIEMTCDTLLAGKRGIADICRDGLRNTFRVSEQALLKPVSGRSVVLTVDWRLQEIVEEELRAAVKKHNAKSAQGVFLDCRNGDVLAIAHYDPRESNPKKPIKLRAVTNQFEPGSVFKVITAAGILEAELIDSNDSVFCENGKWRVSGQLLHDDKELGWLTFREIIELSSNIGVAKCAIKLGGERLFETARSFGFGQKLRLGMPGETGGHLAAPRQWSDYTVSALAMGHSVAVSALQMAAGFTAVANGGELLRPKLILGFVDENGCVADRRQRELIAKLMTKITADTLGSFLRNVVQYGTATPVNSEIVAIAGKTGTAQIPDLENRRYFNNKFIGSFAGYFPYEKPLVAGIVLLEEPHPVHYGGWTAGPAFRRIAERYSVINPDIITVSERTLVEQTQESETTVEVPNLIGRNIKQASLEAIKHSIRLRSNGDTGHIVWQFPVADRLVLRGDEILIAVVKPEETKPRMVDLRGFSIREASAFLEFIGAELKVEGHGRVVRQSVQPGQMVSEKTICRLKCRPT